MAKIAVSVEESVQRIQVEQEKIRALEGRRNILNKRLSERLRELKLFLSNRGAALVHRVLLDTLKRNEAKAKGALNRGRILNHKLATIRSAQTSSPEWMRALERVCEAYIRERISLEECEASLDAAIKDIDAEILAQKKKIG
ncbi:MAG: hypothetical protein WA005_17010 [Candidatus Binataceae bacterium]